MHMPLDQSMLGPRDPPSPPVAPGHGLRLNFRVNARHGHRTFLHQHYTNIPHHTGWKHINPPHAAAAHDSNSYGRGIMTVL